MTSNTELPAYDANTEKQQYNDMEKSSSVPPKQCQHEAASTSHIDAQLQQPSAKAAMRALSAALAKAADEDECTKCATESAARALTTFVREIHTAKKSGQWSRQDQKAFKQEAKGLFKGMKGDVKGVWKGEQAGVAVA